MFSTSFGEGIRSGADYAWQTLFDALREAIASTAPLQARLGTLSLAVHQLREQDFPDTDSWLRFEGFLKATGGAAKKPSPAKILSVTSAMTEEEAAKWLQEMVRIFSDLSEESDE